MFQAIVIFFEFYHGCAYLIVYTSYFSDVRAIPKVLDEIKKASESVSKNSVEQTAYFQAMGAKNNLDLAKCREQVEQELQAADSSESPEKKGGTFCNIM